MANKAVCGYIYALTPCVAQLFYRLYLKTDEIVYLN